MSSTRTAVAALVAAATIAAPAAAAPAPAASAKSALAGQAVKPKLRVPNLVDVTPTSVWLSPNGDRVKDRARIPFRLKRKAMVTVKVYRPRERKDPKLVLNDRLGTLPRGKYTFRWNGKKPGGRIVRDHRYQVSVLVDPVKKRLKKDDDFTFAYVDTMYTPEPLQANATTVYPTSTAISDEIGFNHGGWAANGVKENVRTVRVVVEDAAGNVVRSRRQAYQSEQYYPVTWDGRDDDGAAVPAGTYNVRLDVVDAAGNEGTSDPIEVTVSAAPLVLARGARTVAPVSAALPPAPAGGSSAPTRADDVRSSTTGGDDVPSEPCGVVFASTIYPDQGASFRSRSGCTFWSRNEARASGVLALRDLNAPRGLHSVRLSMRGRPTLDGETDTAVIGFGLQGRGADMRTTTQAVAGETVTTTPLLDNPWEATRHPGAVGVGWTIWTFGFDSYDVADVTADFTYLTPQL